MRITATALLLATMALSACTSRVELPNNDPRALVDAIRAANRTPGTQTIRLARNGLYVLAREAEPGLLLPSIRGKLVIEGNGAEIRAYTSSRAALLEVGQHGNARLRQLSLAEGSNGAIRNFGKLALESSRVVDSTGSRVSAIILNHGELIASDSEFAYNTLENGQRDAGTLLNYGKLTLRDSRIHDNRVQRAHPGLVAAGAVLNMGMLSFESTLLEDNVAADAEVDSGQPAYLRFAGVLNLGNGRVEGRLPSGAARNAGTSLLPASDL